MVVASVVIFFIRVAYQTSCGDNSEAQAQQGSILWNFFFLNVLSLQLEDNATSGTKLKVGKKVKSNDIWNKPIRDVLSIIVPFTSKAFT